MSTERTYPEIPLEFITEEGQTILYKDGRSQTFREIRGSYGYKRVIYIEDTVTSKGPHTEIVYDPRGIV
jgi:hypothetical protein